MALRDLWRKVTRPRRRDEREPDLRPRLGLHDTRNAEEMSSYVGTPPMPQGLEKPKH